MPTFLDLPHEILLWVYQSLDNVPDAIHLAKSCRLLSHIFDRPQNRRKILLSIIDNTLGTPSPDKTWLEAQFGTGSLWNPSQSEIPPELADPETRTFLTTVGFPITKIPCADFDSTHLSREERRLEPYDGDELYGLRYPDDDSPPTNHCFHFGSVGEWMMMVSGEDGVVSLYDPSGWDHADGYQGTVALSLESFAVLLGMLAGVADKLDPATEVGDDEDEEEEMRRAIGNTLRERMGDYDDCVFDGCKFWDEFFECFLE